MTQTFCVCLSFFRYSSIITHFSPLSHVLTAHAKVMLHVTDGGQRNIEDSIHHAVPIFGISYTSALDHYLYQVEKYGCGAISLIDFENQEKFEMRLDDALNSKK